ncbi:MAG: alpha-L-fucosidase [Chloroflexota bacterium]
MTTAAWFNDARFGLFFHWGHSSQQGVELSWPMVGGNFALPNCEDIPVDQYQASAATFDPQKFDAKEWARLAKEAGAEYAVFTTKHHDGFAMFHTALSDFSIEHTPFKRDIVREWIDAFRAEGLRIGLYFSLIDWHHPDYPAFTDEYRPYNFAKLPRPTPEQWDRFVEFMFGQIRELLTNYGQVDLLWFDGQWERSPDQWRAADLVAMIRELQPEIVINDRLPGGDYDTPEQFVPAQPPARPWEVCLTLNESWGYNPDDTDYKTPRKLVQTLSEIAGMGGRLLLNLGPRGDGTIPREQLECLQAVSDWMRRNRESIHDTIPGLEPWQFYGPATRRGNTIYLHLLMRPYENFTLRGVPIRRIASVRELSSGTELAYTARCSLVDKLLNSDPSGEMTIELPESLIDPLATVVVVEITPH